MLTRDPLRGFLQERREHGDHGAEGEADASTDALVAQGASPAQDRRPLPLRAPRPADEGTSSFREAALLHREEAGATLRRVRETLRRSAATGRCSHPHRLGGFLSESRGVSRKRNASLQFWYTFCELVPGGAHERGSIHGEARWIGGWNTRVVQRTGVARFFCHRTWATDAYRFTFFNRTTDCVSTARHKCNCPQEARGQKGMRLRPRGIRRAFLFMHCNVHSDNRMV